jgi:hypothetical protein
MRDRVLEELLHLSPSFLLSYEKHLYSLGTVEPR